MEGENYPLNLNKRKGKRKFIVFIIIGILIVGGVSAMFFYEYLGKDLEAEDSEIKVTGGGLSSFDTIMAKAKNDGTNPHFLIQNISGDELFKVEHGGNSYFAQLVNCDTIDTDASGRLVCGTDYDTNVTTFCTGNEVGLGNGSCFSIIEIDTTCDGDTCNIANTGTLDGYEASDLLDDTDTNATTECGDGEYLDGSGNCYDFNDSVTTLIETKYYNATQSQIIAGNIDAGTLEDTKHSDGQYDGVTFNFSEVSSTPGLDLRINFTGIDEFNSGVMRFKTSTGLKGEYPIVQMWNYNTGNWEDYPPLAESITFATMTQPVFNADNYIDGGTAQMRIYKATKGNTGNHYYVDWIAIAKGVGVPSGEEIDPHSIHRDGSVYLTDNWDAGDYNITAESFIGDGKYLTGLTNHTDEVYNTWGEWFYNQTQAVYDLWNGIWSSSYDPTNIVFSNGTNLPSTWDITNYTAGTDISISGHIIAYTGTGGAMDYTNLALTNQSEEFEKDLNISGNLSVGTGDKFLEIFLSEGDVIFQTDYVANFSSIRINATNCDTIDTDSEGMLICGTDETGANGMDYTNLVLSNDSSTLAPEWDVTNYTAGDGNLTITGHIISIVYTELKSWLDNLYQPIGAYLTSTQLNASYLRTITSFSGEVSGTYDNIVIDDDALDDQYYDSESDLTGLLDDNYADIQWGYNMSQFPWQPNGDNIYYKDGKVGIGTTAPTHTLNTYGTFNLTRTDGKAQVYENATCTIIQGETSTLEIC